MKVMHLVAAGEAPAVGRHLLVLLPALAKHHDVTLVCLDDADLAARARELGLRVRVVRGNPLALRKKLYTGLSINGYGLLHCHGSGADRYGSWLRRKLDIPVVSTVYADPWQGKWRGRRELCRRNGLVTVSGTVARSLERRGLGAAPVYTAVEFPKRIRCMARGDFLRSIGVTWPQDSVIFGAAVPASGAEQARRWLDAFAVAAQRSSRARLLLISDDAVRAKLEPLAARCPAGTVWFAPEDTDRDSFYHSVDVNLCCCSQEEFPLMALEGAVMYCPAVCMAGGDGPVAVEDGQTGLLMGAGDGDAMVQCMETLVRDPGLRVRLGRQMREKVYAEFSPDALARRQCAAYDAVFAARM